MRGQCLRVLRHHASSARLVSRPSFSSGCCTAGTGISKRNARSGARDERASRSEAAATQQRDLLDELRVEVAATDERDDGGDDLDELERRDLFSSHARNWPRSGAYGDVIEGHSSSALHRGTDLAPHGFNAWLRKCGARAGCQRGRRRAPARSIPSTMRPSSAASIALDSRRPSARSSA